jgi:prepilin-type N-terminal cleavage/methylation domain-containing protein
MKTPINGIRTWPQGKSAGFTLAEMLVALGIFSMLIAWMVSAQIYGMRVYTLAATKLVATAGARHAMDEIRDQIREANEVDVGNCSSDWTSFSVITNGAQQGNAMEIFPTTNSTPYLIFYLQTGGTNQLMRYDSSRDTAQQLANFITNEVVFDAEDLWGNVQTNNVNNRVIRITLQFSQWEYPIGRVGGTNFNSYNLYQLRSRVTRRAVD